MGQFIVVASGAAVVPLDRVVSAEVGSTAGTIVIHADDGTGSTVSYTLTMGTTQPEAEAALVRLFAAIDPTIYAA